MAARIYSLAKELKLDSKVLVDMCPKAGVHGKGSALASLSQDEEDRLRAYLTKATARSSPAASAVAQPAPAREQRTVKTLPSGQKRQRIGDTGLEPAFEISEGDPPPLEQTHELEPAVASSPAPPVVVEDPSPLAPPPLSEQHARLEPSSGEENGELAAEPPTPTQRRPLTPGNQGQLRNLAKGRRRDGDNKARPGESPKPDGGSTIRVAAMPAVKEPPKKSQKNEPAPQKPDIKLPADAIRSVKSGSGALQERVRKQLEEKQRKKEAKKRGEVVEETGTAAPRRRRGGGGRDATVAPAPADPGTVSRDERTHKRKRGRGGVRRSGEDDGGSDRRQKTWQRTGRDTSKPRKGKVVVQLPCTIRSFSEALGTPAAGVLFKLRNLTGATSNHNAGLDLETAEMLAGELGYEVEFKHPIDLERQMLERFEQAVADHPERLQPRAPIVTFLGHVDHGKTSLLDRIIGLNVVAGEAGGITQHIRAYTIEKDGKQIAFVDTPGHEAFTEMRARGANVTDIAVLVVAADDGVMPQTEEAISHARAAKVPIVVALNKIDLPGIDENRIMQQLAANELLPSEWGGDVEVVRCSAIKGTGMDTLLETILTVAELHEYKADPDRPATGTCLEAERHEGHGVMAKVIVQDGTLHVGDIIVCGTTHGRVKAMHDTLRPGVKYESAPPSTAVNLTGLDEVPKAGERFYVLDDIVKAREIAGVRGESTRTSELSGAIKHVSLENLLTRLEEGKSFLPGDELQTLNVIVRADTRGSIEAIEKEFTKLHHAEVQIRILQKLVGGVTEADVHLADASDAIILAFNVVPDEKARALAQQKGVEIRRYDIIYRVTEDIKAALEGMLKPNKEEVEMGAALVKRVFSISRLGSIAGCHVMRGTIRREGQVRMRVIRNNTIIGDYPLDSLRREKDDAKEVRQGLECGIKLAGFNDVKEGDVLEAYKIQEVARTL